MKRSAIFILSLSFFASSALTTSLLAATDEGEFYCSFESLGPKYMANQGGNIRIWALSGRKKIRGGKATLKISSEDVRPVRDLIPKERFAPEKVPSSVTYEAMLEVGKMITIKATAKEVADEPETFFVSAPYAPEKEGQLPGLTMNVKLKASLDPELRFDDNISEGIEIQCVHNP